MGCGRVKMGKVSGGRDGVRGCEDGVRRCEDWVGGVNISTGVMIGCGVEAGVWRVWWKVTVSVVWCSRCVCIESDRTSMVKKMNLVSERVRPDPCREFVRIEVEEIGV